MAEGNTPMRRTATLIAALLLATPGPVAGQLCLGRSLPGEATIVLDLAVAPVARLSVGDQTESGIGWRLALVGSGSSNSPPSVKGAQAELTLEKPLSESLSVCPGLSYGRTFPFVEDDFGAYALLDLFTSFATHHRRDDGRTVVASLTPHLVLGFQEPLEVTNPNAPGAGLIPENADLRPEGALALTLGLGIIGERFTFRFTFTGLPSVGMPLVGIGVGIRL